MKTNTAVSGSSKKLPLLPELHRLTKVTTCVRCDEYTPNTPVRRVEGGAKVAKGEINGECGRYNRTTRPHHIACPDKAGVLMNDYYGIRPAPGVCCPDASCGYTSYNGATCDGCGKACNTCQIYKKRLEEQGAV